MAISRPMRESPENIIFSRDDDVWTNPFMRRVRSSSEESFGGGITTGV